MKTPLLEMQTGYDSSIPPMPATTPEHSGGVRKECEVGCELEEVCQERCEREGVCWEKREMEEGQQKGFM